MQFDPHQNTFIFKPTKNLEEKQIKRRDHHQMDFKHFSHIHELVFHQVQQGSEIHCSGCKYPGSGNVYACWPCNYFLHEQCFRATRSLYNPTHPLHPLTLVPYPTHASNTFHCNSCTHKGDGLSYCCAECDFDLHVHCAYMPNATPSFLTQTESHNFNPHHQNPLYPPVPNNNPYPNYSQPQNTTLYPPNFPPTNPNPQIPQFPNYPPQNVPYTNPTPPQPIPATQTYTPPLTTTTTTTPIYTPPVISPTTTNTTTPPPKPPSLIKHFSHPHVLKPMEIDEKNAKVCNACECRLSGSSYCCTEANCSFNLHKICFDSPQEVRHKCHLAHPLKLLTASPYPDGFTCNACLKDGKAFAYNCATCGYDLHIDCISWPEAVTRSDHKHTLNLYYSSPAAEVNQEVVFMCDVCKNPVHEMAWVYYCRDCDFGTHLECVASGMQPAAEAGTSEEELINETALKFAMLQILLNGGRGK